MIQIAPNYQSARNHFLSVAKEIGAPLEDFQLNDQTGINGEPLVCDVASFGDPAADKCLVITSGIHGVEGFCGSAIQCALMASDKLPDPDSNIQTLLVHALNPYGFSYSRRVNEENVDLNRNFVDFPKSMSIANDYSTFRQQIFPDNWNGSHLDEILATIDSYIEDIGIDRFQAELTKGQYEFRNDPFYGGQQDSWTKKVWDQICKKIAGQASIVAHLDIHTGLGDFGTCELIYGGRVITENINFAQEWFGANDVKIPKLGDSQSAEVSGPLASHMDRYNVLNVAIGLEFGTVALKQMLLAVIADNWLAQNPDCNTTLAKEINSSMRKVFFCNTPDWLNAVWEQAIFRINQAINGLGRA